MVAFTNTLTIWVLPTALKIASILAINFLSSMLTRPAIVWIKGTFFSVLTVKLSAENLSASALVLTNVPFFGLGIKPLGPKSLAKTTNFGIMSAVASKTSK